MQNTFGDQKAEFEFGWGRQEGVPSKQGVGLVQVDLAQIPVNLEEVNNAFANKRKREWPMEEASSVEATKRFKRLKLNSYRFDQTNSAPEMSFYDQLFGELEKKSEQKGLTDDWSPQAQDPNHLASQSTHLGSWESSNGGFLNMVDGEVFCSNSGGAPTLKDPSSYHDEEDDQMRDEEHQESKEEKVRKQKEWVQKQLHRYRQELHYYNGLPRLDCCDPLPRTT